MQRGARDILFIDLTDNRCIILFITRLLRQLHKFLSQAEQKELSVKLQSVVLTTRTESKDDLSESKDRPKEADTEKSSTGVPVLRRIKPVEYQFIFVI